MQHPVQLDDGADTPRRRRGPHPLPVFLAAVAAGCEGDPGRLERVLAGLRRYQAAPPAPHRRDHPVIARIGNVTLRDHSPAARRAGAATGRPVVIVPSLINAPDVVDLAPGNSLTAGLAAAGVRPLVVDWGDTEPHGLAAAVAERLMPLIAMLGEAVPVAGYCLGGTLALAAASLGARVSRLALLATPWHFRGYDDAARAGMADWWAGAAPLATRLGAMPMDLLQPAFWALDPAGIAAKYAEFAVSTGPASAFVQLEDWANSGVPLSVAASRDLAETLFAADASGRGEWIIAGRRIDPATLAIPILDIIAGRDRIVPPGAVLTTNGPGTRLIVDAGHVGMVVGRRAPSLLWAPLADFLKG